MILAELSGAANLELRLDRALAERRAYPAIAAGSTTRHEDALLDDATRDQIVALRRHLADLIANSGGPAAHAELLDRLGASKTTTNSPARWSPSRPPPPSLGDRHEVRHHPEYRPVVFQDMSAGTSFIIV